MYAGGECYGSMMPGRVTGYVDKLLVMVVPSSGPVGFPRIILTPLASSVNNKLALSASRWANRASPVRPGAVLTPRVLYATFEVSLSRLHLPPLEWDQDDATGICS